MPATTITSKKKLLARVIRKVLAYSFLMTRFFFSQPMTSLTRVAVSTPRRKLKP